MQERVLYKSRTTKAKKHPEEFMSIIIDGMNSCNIPLKMPMPKGKVFFVFLKNFYNFLKKINEALRFFFFLKKCFTFFFINFNRDIKTYKT